MQGCLVPGCVGQDGKQRNQDGVAGLGGEWREATGERLDDAKAGACVHSEGCCGSGAGGAGGGMIQKMWSMSLMGADFCLH